MALSGCNRRRGKPAEERNVGNYRDQPEQHIGHKRANTSDAKPNQGEQNDSSIGCKVAQGVVDLAQLRRLVEECSRQELDTEGKGS